MAIKIIKNTMTEPIEKICDNCESIFSFNYTDIESCERYGLFGYTYHERFVTCPVCKTICYLKNVQVRKEIEVSQSFVDEGNTNESK